MATYFPSSSNQGEAAPSLYLREPLPSFSEAPVLSGNMMMYMNYSSSSGSYSDSLARISQQQSSCIDIPSMGPSDPTPPQQEILSNLEGSRIVEHDPNTWRGRNEMLFMHPMGGNTGILQGGHNLQGQGLSLSLGTQIPSGIQMPSIQYRNPNPGFSSFLGPNPSVSGEGSGRNGSSKDDENSQIKQSRYAEYLPPGFPGGNSDSIKADISPYGMSSIARTIPNSKYLKVAQQLLDEVVNVRKALKHHDSGKELIKGSREVDGGSKNETALPSNPQESTSNSTSELSAAERQDLQNKMTKLLSMLDEVDRRYKQYYHQMQIVVSSFDVIAGCGAAKPYTALALQTISRHFRCLRDGITDQIRIARRSLGEQDASANGRGVGITRLRYVDQQLRQQRALQQLGMMQQHAWRPQRGLPENSVSVLRAWLFEHFLHPYPKDSDKIMLARQTGLTRSQVSNWFINARVRLWKPMVEEMYKEEIGDAEMDSNSSSDIAPNATRSDVKASEDRGEDFQQSASSTATQHRRPEQNVVDAEMKGPNSDAILQNGTTRGEIEMEYGVVKSRVEGRPGEENCSLFQDTIVQSNGNNERFMAATSAFHMSELGRFGSGNGVSLTLGLQHCEEGTLPLSVGAHNSFVAMRGDDVYNVTSSFVGSDTADFDCMDSGNQQHRFGSSHLLHDFVA